ncbi:hypothetical protein CHS0354_000403 [Potamilus streckersoni]|uniref:Uncharacterized protein n=1 Tax=Potamilus streckersoni TaxID=2493646 RepID=A0AAE0WBP4_9BIVA|nr:hypothetical protein CHS0354_000403 [Potamilus streckersoni]
MVMGTATFSVVTSYSRQTIRSLIRGDQIAVDGRIKGGDYYHHSINLGGGRVADFGGDSKSDAKPRIASIEEFTDNGKRKLVRINYMLGQCLSPEEAARNAKELVKKPDRWGS